MTGPGLKADLEAAATEELERARTLDWRGLCAQVPWGDAYEGFTPLGRSVTFERNYIWEGDPGGDIRIEITVFEAEAYEDGARANGVIGPPQTGADE